MVDRQGLEPWTLGKTFAFLSLLLCFPSQKKSFYALFCLHPKKPCFSGTPYQWVPLIKKLVPRTNFYWWTARDSNPGPTDYFTTTIFTAYPSKDSLWSGLCLHLF